MTRLRTHILSCLAAVGLMAMATVLGQSLAYGEAYIGGQLGVTLPGDLSGVNITTPGFTTLSLSDQDLQKSLMGGFKAGFYLPRIRWFGLESEIFYTTPHIKQQQLTFKGPGGTASTNFAGLNHHVLTVAPINFMFRYHKTRLQPYVGIGPGIFFARIKDPSITSGDNTQSSNWKIGLNSQAGLRYYITRHWAMSGELKYTYAPMNYQDTTNLFGFKANYSALTFAFGLSYHF